MTPETALSMSYEQFSHAAAPAREALVALSRAAADSGLDKILIELVKLRASQINGCAFCLQLHLNMARKLGAPAEKLDLVAAWRDAGVFSEREKAALAWTEAMTTMSECAREAAEGALMSQFSLSEAMFLTIAIGTINQWNRIAVALRFPPPIVRAAAAS
jgi:AhpD family alkylhydroperoxidase